MSILDTFTLIFDVESSEATDDVKKFDKGVADTEKSVKKLVTQLGKLAAAYFGLSKIKGGILDNAANIDDVGKFSQTLGFNITKVDAWGAAVKLNGGSADSFRSSLSSLNSELSNFELGGASTGFSETLARLGISAIDSQGDFKDAFQILEDVAGAFDGLSEKQSFALGQRLGLDQGTILLLQQSRYQVEALVKQQEDLANTTNDNYEAAAQFNDAMDNTERKYNSMYQAVNGVVLPILTKFLNGLNDVSDWAAKHEDLVTGFFIAIGSAVTLYALPALASLSVALLTNPITGLATVIGGVAIAFALLYEDIKAYNAGQNSFIGDFLDQYPKVAAVFDDIGEAARKLGEWLGVLFTNPQKAIDSLKAKVSELFEFIKNEAGDIGDLFDSLNPFSSDEKRDISKKNYKGDGLDLPMFGEEVESEKKSSGLDLPMFGNMDQIMQNTQKGIGMQQAYAANPMNSGNSISSMTSNSRSVNVSFGETRIDARGMTASEAQQLVSESYRRDLTNAVAQLNDGEIS